MSNESAPKRQRVLSTCYNGHGSNVPFYTNKDGEKTKCVDCVKKSNSKYQAIHGPSIRADFKARASSPMESSCEWHPDCDWWNTAGNTCGFCHAEFNLVGHAMEKDSAKGLECTMTRQHVRLCIGVACAICGYGPLLPQPDARNPRQLSMDRIDNSKPHDCDPSQTRAVCLQCNLGKWVYTDEQLFVYLDGIVAGICDTVSADVIAEIDAYMIKKMSNKKTIRNYDKNGNLKNQEDIVPFTLTIDEAFSQLRSQFYCCSLCHLALSVKDCTFDQTNAKNGYVAGMFTFMHQVCNSLKGIWTVEVAIETARRAVAFRNSKINNV